MCQAGLVIVGIGIDLVPVLRFEEALRRTPRLAERLFTASERVTRSQQTRSTQSLAARFAGKEALAKALGAPVGLRWTDAEITTDDLGAPTLAIKGSVARRATELGVSRWHVSLSHDGGIASAIVVLEASEPGRKVQA